MNQTWSALAVAAIGLVVGKVIGWWSMIESAEEFVRLRRSQVLDEYTRAAHDEASVQVWSDIIERYPDMRGWVANNKTVPMEVLAFLASDPDPSVRYSVAMKRKLSPELFLLLAVDSNETVRAVLAANAKAPLELLETLSRDASPLVCEAAESALSRRHPGKSAQTE